MRDHSHRPLLHLRTAIAELVDTMRQWDNPDPQVMIEALWLITLDGVPNSGVRKGTSQKVLRLMEEIAQGEISPTETLERMREWTR